MLSEHLSKLEIFKEANKENQLVYAGHTLAEDPKTGKTISKPYYETVNAYTFPKVPGIGMYRKFNGWILFYLPKHTDIINIASDLDASSVIKLIIEYLGGVDFSKMSHEQIEESHYLSDLQDKIIEVEAIQEERKRSKMDKIRLARLVKQMEKDAQVDM